MPNDVNKTKTFFPKSIEEISTLLNTKEKEIKIQIKVGANSKKNSIEFSEDYIKVKISKPAVEGKANKEIISYFSDILNLPKNNIKILNGEKSSVKTLLLRSKSLQ